MTTTRARLGALAMLASTAAMTERLDAQQQTQGKWVLCGAGKYDLTAGGQSLGSETFDVTCRPDGHYVATGRTQLSGGGAAIDLTTNLELGPDLLPITAAAKGTVQGQPLDQSGTFSNGTATLVTNGRSQSVPYTAGASWLGGNIFYTNAFIVARYDEAKGGRQEFPVFPQMTVTLERVASDAVRLDNGDAATYTRFVMRIAGQEIVLWRDPSGRLAVIGVPAQRFAAVRPESAKWLPALMASLANGSTSTSPKPASPATSTIDYSA